MAERRVCSVLFVDLVGFTPLSEARDPEAVRELLSRYFDATRTVIGRYGGTVEKFIGDAVMAVWGAPVATEADAERAVRAALDVVDAVAAMGAEVGAADLAARGGVVTGEVAVTLGAQGEGMVAGDPVNTAARVQSAATPGAVFVDDTTRRLAAAAIGFADAGAHELEGKSEPQELWQATRVLALRGGVQRIDGLEAPLIGREPELRAIKDLFHATVQRRAPRLVVVTGIAGVGKSRLGWEFEKHLGGLAQDVLWHRGRCLSYGEGVAFWALAQAVRQRLGIAEDDAVEVAAAKLAAGTAAVIADPAERQYVAARLGRLLGVAVDGDAGPALAQEELFAGWRMFFERLAATDPLVWLIEDAQYADPELLEFVAHLLDWTRDLPIFVLVLGRSELSEKFPGFGVGRNRTMLTVEPLDGASMDELVDALVPGMPAAARAAITQHAQGVPLFAVETIRSLVDRDVVQPIEGRYRLVGDVGTLTVPDSLHGLLAARLDGLTPSVRALAADAAVLGTSFPAEALVAVSDQDEPAVRSGLAELVRREVLHVSADPLSPERGAYQFAQQLVRQVAYDTLSRRDRRSRHLAVAAHLRATFADDGEEVADVVARHYLDALAAVPDGPDSEAIRAQAIGSLIRAAERASGTGAPRAAAESYRSAAELGEAAGMADAAGWWEQTAKAADIAGDYVAAVKSARRAQQLHTSASDPRAAARAQSAAGRPLRRAGRHGEAREQLTTALEVLRSEPDVDTVLAMTELANLEVFAGSPDGDRLSAEALALGQALDVDDSVLARLFVTRGLAHAYANRGAQAAASYEYAARLAERGADSMYQGLALSNLADVLMGFDPPAAADAAGRSVELLRRLGARDGIAFAVTNLAGIHLATGHWDDAHSLLDAATTRDGLDDQDYLQAYRGLLAALRGNLTPDANVHAALSRLEASEDPQDQSMGATVEAAAAEASGDTTQALASCRHTLNQAEATGISAEAIRWAWPLAARIAHARHDEATTTELLAMLDRHPIGHLPPILRAERDLARARLATAADPATAAPMYDAAITGLRRIPAPYHLAHALLDQAENLTARDEHDAAAEAVAEAAAIADRLGATPLAARARSTTLRSAAPGTRFPADER